MIIRPAREPDLPGFLKLAAQVENWFGPMVEDPGFRRAVERHIRFSTALVAGSPEMLGGLLFGGRAPIHHVSWIVVAERARGKGAGRALMREALRRFVRPPAT